MESITLISKDRQRFKISEKACVLSRYLNNYIIDFPLETTIYFSNIPHPTAKPKYCGARAYRHGLKVCLTVL